MSTLRIITALTCLITASDAFAQATVGSQLADLNALRSSVGSSETRIRVPAMHRVWTIALDASASEVKLSALDLLEAPAGSSSDHIRLPAIYAIVEIAHSTNDVRIKLRSLYALAEPLRASQVPIRDVAIEAVSSISRSARNDELTLDAVRALAESIRSANNAVRMPAISALVTVVRTSPHQRAFEEALDLLLAPLESSAVVGGMEARMLAVVAVERIGAEAPEVVTKAKALGMMRTYVLKATWETEARVRAKEAASRIEGSMKP